MGGDEMGLSGKELKSKLMKLPNEKLNVLTFGLLRPMEKFIILSDIFHEFRGSCVRENDRGSAVCLDGVFLVYRKINGSDSLGLNAICVGDGRGFNFNESILVIRVDY